MKYIQLSQEYKAIVDDCDYEHLSQWKWFAHKEGKVVYAYRKIKGTGKLEAMHRCILKPPKGYIVDHVDHNGLNNQRFNMRVCTRSQNAWNVGKRSHNTSGYKGVHVSKDGNITAKITCNKKVIRLGSFSTRNDAYSAYCIASKMYHGEYANY